MTVTTTLKSAPPTAWFGMAVVVASLAVVVLERPAKEPREVGEPVPT